MTCTTLPLFDLQMPINASNAGTLAHQVRTYTLEAAGFTDTVDVLYVAQLMSKFMEYVGQLREVRRPCFISIVLMIIFVVLIYNSYNSH